MDYIWALDVSMSNTGLVIFEDDDSKSVVLVTSIDTHDGKTHQEKLKILGNKIEQYKKQYPPSEICSEKGFYRYAASTEAIYKSHGVIAYVLWDIPLYEYSPMSVKKGITGKGNVKKEEVRDFILKKYVNVKFDNMDQSDAYSVGLFHFLKKGIMLK